jgi:hypothetical protein
MEINEILTAIREDLSIEYTSSAMNNSLTRKVKGAIADLKEAGVTETQITSDLGLIAIQTYVIDNWTLEAGKRVQSPSYLSQVAKLRLMEEVETDDEVSI